MVQLFTAAESFQNVVCLVWGSFSISLVLDYCGKGGFLFQSLTPN